VNEALVSWARKSGPRKVLAVARRRLEAGRSLDGSPLRVDLSPRERDEVGDLLGMTWARSGRSVGARALASAINERGTDVTGLLAAAGMPVRPLAAERQDAVRRAQAEREQAAGLLTAAGVPAQTAAMWLTRRGLPAAGNGKLADLAGQCALAWRALPRPGQERVLLPVFAARVLGDPHALDRGSAAASGLLRLLGHEPPDSAEAWRAAWEAHGIDCDPVSSRVLVLNLQLDGNASCVRLTRAAGAEPLWLTLRSLTGSVVAAGLEVHVCENPSILIAAADVLGERCRPLVCTNGRPSAATMTLLTRLADSGAMLHVRADDDAAGQEIVAGIRAAIARTRLWRYDVRPPITPRYEEQDLPALLGDLGSDR
jgi:uncharacterized protein (TIGR02679 family)